MIVTLDTWKRIARLGHAASDDAERPALTGIQLKFTRQRLWGTATDAYVLVVNEVGVDREPADPEEWQGVIRARQALCVEKDVRSLERYRSKKDHPDESLRLRVTIDDESVEVTLAEDGSMMFDVESITRRLDLIPGDYPDHSALVETEVVAGPPSTLINPEKITQLGKTVDEAHWPIRLDIPADHKPIRCSSPLEPLWAGLVMPVRGPDE